MIKYRVYTETGYTEFINSEDAVNFHSEYGIQPIEEINFELQEPIID